MMRTGCLVIGGGGLIGAHLVPKLMQSGRRVTVLGRGAIPAHLLPKGVTYISGDFGNHNLIKPLLDAHNEIIHLAYATVPNTSFDNPLEDLLQNLPPTVQLFSEVAARGGRLVLVSSGSRSMVRQCHSQYQKAIPRNRSLRMVLLNLLWRNMPVYILLPMGCRS